jgi:stage II sporulation protein AB (anti-sigma F factor)
MSNKMQIIFDAVSENESFARVAVAAFVASCNPTLEEVVDIKTAVSEAVTNAIIHGYEPGMAQETVGKVWLTCVLEGDLLHIEVRDEGKGIEDVERAMEPLFTTKPELDRSGMGFAFMEAFMDDLEVESKVGCGTTVRMQKKMGVEAWICEMGGEF